MQISSYGLAILVILGISTPMFAFAEIENEANEGTNEINSQQAGHEGSEKSGSVNSDLILFVTIAAISSVVGYSGWKVYKIRKRTTPKTVV